MSNEDIFGEIDTALADRISSEALKGLNEAGNKVDINGVKDSRVKTPNMGVGADGE